MNYFTIIFMLQLSVMARGRVISDSATARAVNRPRYAFNYATNNPSRDKAQYENRDGGLINAYSLLEPDGGLRLMEYSADDISGFSAIVKSLASSLGKAPLTMPLPYPLPPINPSIDPQSYGFGAAPDRAEISQVKVTGSSHPWDPKTGSFGGWVPLKKRSPKVAYATILNKKYVNGKLKKIVYYPVPLRNKSVILIKKKPLDD